MKTPTYPRKNPYEYADKIVRYLIKRAVRMFSSIRLLPFDELNVLHGTKDLYDELWEVVRTYFLRLAREVYARERGLSTRSRGVRRRIDPITLDEWLMAYNPVMKVMFKNDWERMAALYAEGILGTGDVGGERKTALKRITKHLWEESILITDQAAHEAQVDMGVKKVMWLTRDDELRCAECKDLHGTVWDIDKVPPKPHRNCRCWLVPVKEAS